MSERLPRVVNVGAGLGGLCAARALRKLPAEIITLERRNDNLFQPLLYQLDTAGLSPGEIVLMVFPFFD